MQMSGYEELYDDFKNKKNNKDLSENTTKLYRKFLKLAKEDKLNEDCFNSFKDFFLYEDYEDITEYTLKIYISFLDLNQELNDDNLRKYRESILPEDLEYIKYFEELVPKRSPTTMKSYRIVLRQFTRTINLLPYEYINEAKDEQLSYIEKRKDGKEYIIEPDVEDTNLKIYFDMFKKMFDDKDLKPGTAHLKSGIVRTFYRYCGVKNLPKIVTEDSHTNKEPLTHDIIKIAISKAKKRAAAAIAFACSTGIRSYDIRHFSIGFWLESLNLTSLEELFNLEDYDIVGYMKFVPNKTKRKGIVCQVCSSGYSTMLIVDYLKERSAFGEELTLESPLFATVYGGKTLSRDGFSRIFTRLNPKIRQEQINLYKNQLEYGLISDEEYEKLVETIPYFTAHRCRGFFISQITKGNNPSINLTMEAHRSNVPTHKNYIGFEEKEIREYYATVEKYLRFDINKLTDDEREQIKEQIKEEVQSEFEEELAAKDEQIKEMQKQIAKINKQQAELNRHLKQPIWRITEEEKQRMRRIG